MKKNISRFIKYALLLCVIIFLVEVFLPRQYDVPLPQKRASTQYWHLSSGSEIGYTVVKAKGIKKPFPLIYLHGGPGGAVSDRAIQSLSVLADDGYDVYLYDQVGSGQSNRLEDINEYTPARHVSDLKAIIEKIGAQKVILIGQSWGSILAVLFTADNSDKVEKIIFTSPGPIYPYRLELANITAPNSFHLRAPYYSNAEGNKKANNIRTKTMAFFATAFGKKLAPDKEADAFATYLNYEVNKSVVCDTSKILPPEAGSGYYASVMTFQNLLQVKDPRPEIKNSTIPILVMKGQCDNQLWGYASEYLDLFSNHQLVVIPDAGHAISIEQPEVYIKTIRNFLSR